jgi:hypothetical protein
MALNLSKVKANFQRLKQNLPKQIQNEGQRFFIKNFDAQQWDGVSWQPRIERRNARKLLVRRGGLRRAVAGSKREATFSKIRFEVFVQSKKGYNYAEVHNEGLAKMPRRKFLGESKTLDAIIRKKIKNEIANCFK